MSQSWDLGIFPVGPSGLMHILSHARFHIVEERQSREYDKMLHEMHQLVHHLATLQDHARRVGRHLQGAMTAYDRMAGTHNSSILGKLKTMRSLGLQEKIPPALERFQWVATQASSEETLPVLGVDDAL
jgi:DNA recombination protein RmuC